MIPSGLRSDSASLPLLRSCRRTCESSSDLRPCVPRPFLFLRKRLQNAIRRLASGPGQSLKKAVPKLNDEVRRFGGGPSAKRYLSSTVAPTASSFFFISSASFLGTLSFTGL